MPKIKLIMIAVAGGLLLLGYGLAVIWNRPLPARTGGATVAPAPAPDFALKDYNGNTVTLSQFRGKPVVVNSWAAWCPFCREELKDFAAAKREFGDRIEIIAIDRAEPLAVAKKFTDELGVTDALVFLLDPEDSFYRAIGGFSMPETIFVDPEGRIVFHKRGPMTAEEIRERIRQAFSP